MNNSERKAPNEFLYSLTCLLADIEAWVHRHHGIQVVRSKIMLNEEAHGMYETDKLSIVGQDSKRIADVVPVGASVIGANGRVDLIGALDQEILVYLDKGGPNITTSVKAGDHEDIYTSPLYRGIDEAGWYWIESRKVSRGRKLDEALFFDLLAGVSDYEQC